MKRLLLISRCPPYPLYLGDRLIVYHLADELRDRGWAIDLLAFADRPDDWGEIGRYDHLFYQVQLIPEPRRSRLSYLYRGLIPSARWPRRAGASWSPAMWQAIQSRLAETDYHAIHLFGGVQVYEFYHALRGRPALITPYESYSLYLRRALTQNLELRTQNFSDLALRASLAFARRFEHFMFEPYRRVVVVSQPDKDELLSLNPALSVEVIPNGVNTYYFRPRPTRRVKSLLFVGNYEYPPNVDAALHLARDIFPKVRAQLPGVRLWLVGNAPPPQLQSLAGEHIRVTGRVPDVRPYLARAAAFVSPLRLGAGIKNKVLEALAMGCPVVATPLSVDGIDVTPGFDALVAADDAAIVESIVSLLNDDALARKLSANGRGLVEDRYSWTRVAESYRRLYGQLSSHNPG